jgi:hypothetical protein
MKRVRRLIHSLARKLADATKDKKQPYAPEPKELHEGIEHVAYEYSNLVCANQYLDAHPAGGPAAILVLNAFLLSCREMAEFFGKPTGMKDIRAIHYTGQTGARLPHSDSWRDAIDKQLAHITFARTTNPRPGLTQPQTRLDLFRELQAAFRSFLPTVRDQAHRDEFRDWLIRRSREAQVSLP